MEHFDPKATDDDNVADRSEDRSGENHNAAGCGADDSERPSETTPQGPTAIERQIAADAARRYRARDRHVLDYNTYRRRGRRFNSAGFLGLFLLVAAGIAIVIAWRFTDLGHLSQQTNKAVAPTTQQTVAPANALAAADSQPPTEPAPAANPLTASAAPTDTRKNSADTSASDAISIPIADVSLRDRPELLEQLVQVYKSQLEKNENDAIALAALKQLQAQSLSQLQTIIAQDDEATAVRSLEIVARLFPELADNVRYKYLVARAGYNSRPLKAEPVAKAETPPATPPTSSEKAVSSTANSAAPSSAAPAKRSTENTSSSKPEIRTVSITPGAMVGDRFVPRDSGSAFMVEIGYRNFDKAFVDQNETTLTVRLGLPGDPAVLAEVPVDITGDRGIKTFVMETAVSGRAGEKWRLNFILNDEFLTSRTVRLTMP